MVNFSKCLDGAGVDGKDFKIFTEICWNQKATPRINGTTGKLTQILKGARQGCGLFPEFFKAYG